MQFCGRIAFITMIGLAIKLGLICNTVDNTADAYPRAYSISASGQGRYAQTSKVNKT